jgi:iron complex outermembrane receptor protein
MAALSAGAALPALAQTATTAVAAADNSTQIVVTGTRRINRTVAQSESPVDVLSSRDLQSTGATDLSTVLGQLLPSFNFPRPSVTDASDAVRPAQLRGLSPDQTLVLIDGKRRHTTSIVNVNGSQGRGSSPVDLNAIPLAAIDRIEVLRDGAAAQYGSDAIAGVINIILKKGAKGGSAGLALGQTDKGDGATAAGSASSGLALGDSGWLRFSVEARKQDHTNRAGPDLRDPTEPRYGQVNQRLGDPDTRQTAAVLNGQFALTPGLDAYATATLSRRTASAAATWRTAQTAVGSGVLRTPLYPQGFLPLEDSVTTDIGLIAGLRGDVAGWQVDLSLNHGRNRFVLDVDNTVNLSLGASSPTSFHAGALGNQQTLVNLDLTRDFDLGLAAPVTLALGAESRSERYLIEAGEPGSYTGSGAQGFSGFRAVNAGSSRRHSNAVYIDAETTLARSWTGGLAVRAERYSDFGNATSAKLSTRYAFSPAVALRGTASTGFRAPSLAQQNYTITTTNFIVVNGVSTPLDTGTFAVGSAAAQALGAAPLKAEKSRNLSIGLLLQPLPQWQVTADAYQIEIDNRVLFSANLVLPTSLVNALAAQGVLASAARYFTNAVDTRTRGIDIVSTWRQEWGGAGRSDFTLAYNHNKNDVTRVADNPALLTANGLLLIDRQTIGRATVASPSSKLALAAEHTLGAWNARLGLTRYGSYTVPQNSAALDQTFSAAWLADVSVGWRGGPWSATLGVDNLNNRYPDPVTSAGNLNTNGIFRYSNFSPFGFNGRLYYARAGYTW